MRHMRSLIHYMALCCGFLFWTGGAIAATLVRVGGYEFPPFVDGEGGVTRDLIALLNTTQDEYRFEFRATSPRRRYLDFDDKAFDAMFFESRAWGWKERPVDSSRVFLRGDGEIYVALARPDRDEGFLEKPARHTLVVVGGYHYGFADFDADPERLRGRFRITFADTPEAMLRMLLNQRAEVAVVTRSYLAAFLKREGAPKGDFLVSRQFDQRYAHTALVRRGGPITAGALDALLDKLERSGRLRELWSRYGIDAGGE